MATRPSNHCSEKQLFPKKNSLKKKRTKKDKDLIFRIERKATMQKLFETLLKLVQNEKNTLMKFGQPAQQKC